LGRWGTKTIVRGFAGKTATDPIPPYSPRVAVGSSAFIRGAFLMFEILHFVAVKKPQHSNTLASSETLPDLAVC
jgi:hypothetical protein